MLRAGGPLWARLCVLVGVLLLLGSGAALTGGRALVARYAGSVHQVDLFADGPTATPAEPGADLTGPLNLLLVGIDPRESVADWIPRADTVVLVHVPAGLDRAYLISLPRDLLVAVPPYPRVGYHGGQDKLAHAMYLGAQVPGQVGPDVAAGFALLAATVTGYTGLDRIDAGAIVTFTGFVRIVDALGGVTMHLDQDVTSIHRRPDGTHRAPSGTGGEGPDAYVGPQKRYREGTRRLRGWEALDYVRQRYIPGGDYARQRHQMQFLRAMVDQVTDRDVLTDPLKLDRVLRAAGDSLTFSGRGHSVVAYALALRRLRADTVMPVRLRGESVLDASGRYLGERLEPLAAQVFAAVRAQRLAPLLDAHPHLTAPAP
ncbi:MAG TPA: LCP family protein [Pilimelia sp.]|nr:LCP family protein [Pilimelia sp.]